MNTLQRANAFEREMVAFFEFDSSHSQEALKVPDTIEGAVNAAIAGQLHLIPRLESSIGYEGLRKLHGSLGEYLAQKRETQTLSLNDFKCLVYVQKLNLYLNNLQPQSIN